MVASKIKMFRVLVRHGINDMVIILLAPAVGPEIAGKPSCWNDNDALEA